MGMFICCECGRLKSSDDGCNECPKHKDALICQDCLNNMPDSDENTSGSFSGILRGV